VGLDPTRPGQASGYLDHLPALFREPLPNGADPAFLGRFLLAFEHVLTGLGDPADDPEALLGLDERVTRVPEYLDPRSTPTEFVDWLAGWVALTLRADLDADHPGGGRLRARGLVASAVSLYRLRGTGSGLARLLALLTGALPTLIEASAPLQIGPASTLGVDTRVGGGAPNFLRVQIGLAEADPVKRGRMEALARAILDVEKPAHTRYWLEVTTPAMQIGAHARIGVDTLLVPASRPGGPG
jgi:phage tail-like protein